MIEKKKWIISLYEWWTIEIFVGENFHQKKRKRKKNYPKMNKYNQIFWQEKQHQIQISKYLLMMLIISATVIHIGKNNNNWKLHDMIIDSDTKFNKKKIEMKF